ncbi:hypothetical protein OSB04_un001653 [Centaurea solstitialis]|uniref:Integrase catalytic domain-containing protein n=1 Tax=Centaurea solstitialis TaxID=347529 RepID=A0AA38SFJ5_9ASTR|nr:hypothetical protein OSB04_un001653 [Centaurea solstitialis]
MADDQPMWDKRSEVQFTPRSAIKKTDGKMVEINKGLIKMINTISFDGEPSRNPYQHLEAFEDICDLVNTKEDEVRLRVFPFTLTNKAKDWFKKLLPGSITTWDDLKSAFLSRYFPISKANKIRAEIRNFKQGKDSLVKAWGRYKDLFLIFPNHGIDDREMIDVFYAGLTNDSRIRLDSSCGGIFPYKTVKEARKLLDDMETHYLDWSTDEEQEENQPAHLNVVSSSDEHIHATEDFTETPNPLSKPYGGVIEQLFHQFSQEQGKMGADAEQKMHGFVNFIAGLHQSTDQFLRDVKETFPHMEAKTQAEVFTTTRGGVPSYARFLKELVANSARMGTEEIAFLNAECPATLSDTLKKGDPGSFIIPCYFGKSVSCRALADLRASINLMPLSFYQKLGLKGLKSTRMTIQLPDTSIKYPVGVAEDVIVQVDRFEFPADFVILDIKDEVKVPLILGRPFLNTASAIIHVAKRELSLGIGEDRITLSIDGIPDYNESINTLDSELEESLAVEKRWDETMEEEEEDFEELKQEDKVRVKTSLEEPPDLELKDLPEHLEYQFLEDFRKLNDATRKDHFPLPFIDQMLERLAGNEYYCFLDGFSGYFQIPIDPEDQEKTTFTCPFGTFAYRRMPFGLCNAPATFQRCMTAIFQDMIENCMEVFMDDFSFLKCISAFETLKQHLTNAPIMVPPDWDQPFEIMCDASDYAVGAVLGQLCTDHSALKYLFAKPDAKPRLIRWILLLQEFDIEIRDKRGAENLAADHLSRLENPYMDSGGIEVIRDKFPDEGLNMIKTIGEDPIPWYADFANYLAAGVLVKGMTHQQKGKFFSDLKYYFWSKPYLFRVGPDRIHRRCVSGPAAWGILTNCHKGPTGGHFEANLTARKVLESGFYWPTIFKDAHTLIKSCDACQRAGNITKKDEMPQQSISVSEVFDVWGIDFMGPFPDSRGNKYILVAVDYVSKWAEAKASPTNDAKVVVDFVKSLVCRYGCPKAIISDRGTHFANYLLEKTLKRYGVHHRFSTAYHPQANGQAENTNRALKRILEKTVDNNPKIWSQKLEDALWAYRTTYKMPIGSTPYRMLYGKACHLPFESLAYENSKIFKEQRKKWHDVHLKEVKVFKEGDKVLMYQTRFKFSPGKLKSRWIGPYVVLKAYPSGYVDLMTERGSFKVNGHRLKLYNENDPVRNGEYFSSSLLFFSANLFLFCKSMASKRASSSRNVQDHPCLSFDSDNILRSEKMSLMIELDRLKKREVEIGSIVDLHFVEEIGFGDRLSSLLRREYRDHFGVLRFVSNDWEKALKTHEPIYYELVLEFLATFSFDVEAYEEDRFDGPCIRFHLLGEWYGITLPRFAVLLGLFTAAQSRSEYFSQYFLTGACEPSAEFVGADFWGTIGSGPYLQSNTKESFITLPEHRLLHRMLVHSFAYRKAIKEKVPEGDLWLLSRLVNRNAITNLSYVMAKMFQNARKVHDKAGTGLCGGHFIAVIAEKLGTLTPDVCETLTKLSPMGFLDKVLFRSMKLLAPGPQRGTFVWIGDATPNEGPIGMATSPPQPTFPGQSSNPPPTNQQGSGSIHEAIQGLSEQMGVEHHEMMERLDRISYDMYGVRWELSWVAASMSEYFESVGHAPSAPLEPHPVWRDSDDGPAGYTTYNEWAFENRN